VEQRGFSHPRLASDGDHLAARHLQLKVSKDDDLLRATRIDFGQVDGAQQNFPISFYVFQHHH
jgi:hypothetical protein